MAGLPYTTAEAEAYIRQAAIARGIDPNIAVRLARSEGLQRDTWQGKSKLRYGREQSYGPFQLHDPPPGYGYDPGLGSAFKKKTGLDPADPKNWKQGIDFALDNAATGGWGPWFGRKHAGIGVWDGIKGAKAIGVSDVQPVDNINPQEGYNFAGNDPSYKPGSDAFGGINQQRGYGFGEPMGPDYKDAPVRPGGYTANAYPDLTPEPRPGGYTANAYPDNTGAIDVRSAASESLGDMRPTAFQQHSMRQAMEGDQSQLPRLRQAIGLDKGGQRLEPRGTESQGLLDLIKMRMQEAQAAPKVPGQEQPIFGNLFPKIGGTGGGLMSFLSGLFK